MFVNVDSDSRSRAVALHALAGTGPVGWASTLNGNGVAALTPYPNFTLVSENPLHVMFAGNRVSFFGYLNNAANNAPASGEFTFSLATLDLRDQMNATQGFASRNGDGFDVAGLAKSPGNLVACPRVRESPLSFECRHVRSIQLPCYITDWDNTVVFGRVIGVHIDDDVFIDGRIDFSKLPSLDTMG